MRHTEAKAVSEQTEPTPGPGNVIIVPGLTTATLDRCLISLHMECARLSEKVGEEADADMKAIEDSLDTFRRSLKQLMGRVYAKATSRG